MAVAAKQDELLALHLALVAAHQEWVARYRKAHASLSYEELVPVAERLNELLGQLIAASGARCQQDDVLERSSHALTSLADNLELLSDSLARCYALSESVASRTLELRRNRRVKSDRAQPAIAH